MVDNRNLIREFTEEQFEVLESARFNSRCLFQGQAGTGKTVLALELARRKIKDGKKVGLFCYNKRLGESLEESFSKLSQTLNINQSYSGPFYRYLLSNTELSDYREQGSNEFYAEELPIQFLLDNEYPEEQKFDTIIVDEAQDLINEYNLEVFDEMLKGGISNGNWAFFGDLTKQAIYVNDPDSAITLLENKASFTNVPPLRINCRNTRKVARQNTIMTGVAEPAFKPESPEGDSVNIEFPAPNRQLHQVEAAVQSLDEQGIPLNNVSILAPFRYSNTILPESSYLSQKFQEGLEFSTIHAFKGLENEYIIITGFEDLQSELSQMLLYIGLSRARQKLFLIFRDNLNRDYQALIEKNATKANTV
jgi:superfamily I DNA/RNA helicase